MLQKFVLGLVILLQAVHVQLYCVLGQLPRNSNDDTLIQSRIDRLMALRSSNWGWVNTPQVVLGLQLSKQSSFFGKTETIQSMKNELKDEDGLNELDVGELAFYAMAIKSTCRNPRHFFGMNVIRKIKSKLNAQHQSRGSSNGNALPHEGWYKYALAIQALCVNQVRIDQREINLSIQSQDDDGSYGGSLDATSQMLLALQCIWQQRINSRSHLLIPISNAVQFIKQQVTNDLNLAWIGNRYSTPTALLALSAVNQNVNPSILRQIERSLREVCTDDESEAALAQELPALSRRSVLDLNADWVCVSITDPVPEGYQPNNNNNNNSVSTECSQFTQSIGFFDSFFAIFIQVRLSVQYSSQNTIENLVTGIRKENTLLQVMEQARCQGGFEFETVTSSYGPYLTSINGTMADPNLKQYWSISDAATKEPLRLGLGQYLPSDDEHILLKLTTY